MLNAAEQIKDSSHCASHLHLEHRYMCAICAARLVTQRYALCRAWSCSCCVTAILPHCTHHRCLGRWSNRRALCTKSCIYIHAVVFNMVISSQARHALHAEADNKCPSKCSSRGFLGTSCANRSSVPIVTCACSTARWQQQHKSCSHTWCARLLCTSLTCPPLHTLQFGVRVWPTSGIADDTVSTQHANASRVVHHMVAHLLDRMIMRLQQTS